PTQPKRMSAPMPLRATCAAARATRTSSPLSWMPPGRWEGVTDGHALEPDFRVGYQTARRPAPDDRQGEIYGRYAVTRHGAYGGCPQPLCSCACVEHRHDRGAQYAGGDRRVHRAGCGDE